MEAAVFEKGYPSFDAVNDSKPKRKKIKYGTKLLTKHGVLKVNHIDLCENEGDKYGISVEAVWLKDKDRCVFEFENSSNWQYGYQCETVD